MKQNGNYKQASMLVIEDDDDQWLVVRQAIRLVLPEVRAERVASPGEALHSLQEGYREMCNLPRLILLDLYLPSKQDGLDLHTAIKQLGLPFTQMPIVIFSSSNDQADIRQAYQEGVCSYLVKPTTLEGWLAFFQHMRAYWWDTVRLPTPMRRLF